MELAQKTMMFHNNEQKNTGKNLTLFEGVGAVPGSGSRDLNKCGPPMRIRILVRLCRLKKLDFEIKYVLYVGNTWCITASESNCHQLLAA